jgi:hypothetical protein
MSDPILEYAIWSCLRTIQRTHTHKTNSVQQICINKATVQTWSNIKGRTASYKPVCILHILRPPNLTKVFSDFHRPQSKCGVGILPTLTFLHYVVLATVNQNVNLMQNSKMLSRKFRSNAVKTLLSFSFLVLISPLIHFSALYPLSNVRKMV